MEHAFPMIDIKATGRRIKELREQRGISVRQLQTFLGFEQPQAIYKWQRGECLPTFDNMYAMACFFHVKVDEILVGNRQDFDIKRMDWQSGGFDTCLHGLIRTIIKCSAGWRCRCLSRMWPACPSG